ncbi:early nodulin-like protein 8 [Perilla frutescens var. hirtella]|nr:early nodulin-like protein 8 [Perilla frutescens var. frutescens]KAH6792553.1 early nodulin-like protein 8 [Perilla frutescens var. hirtella]
MATLKSPKSKLFYTLILFLSLQSKVSCSIYQVGDLDAWGLPTSSNSKVYTNWANYHELKIGDSLFFLYPPSQDSVIQVTKDSYDSCNIKDPILLMNNGNSLFNITKPGNYYFTSGVDGHCGKAQKLHISVYGNGSFVDDSPASGPAASAPSYPTVFGSIPVQAASISPSLEIPVLMAAAAGVLLPLLLM